MNSEGEPPPGEGSEPDGQQPGWGQQPPPPPPPPGPGAGWGGGYAPPPQGAYAYVRQDHPQATTALVLGIVGLVLCSIAAPFAWRIGKNAVDEIDRSQGTLGGRGQAYAGQILGLIGTIVLVLGVVAFLGVFVFGIASVSMSS